MIVRHSRLRRGYRVAACVPDYNPEGASLEIPVWMFDKTHCSQMHLSTRPRVCWMALAELSFLIEKIRCQSPLNKVKNQHRFFPGEGGADASCRSIPSSGTTKPVSSSPQTTPMEKDAQSNPARRAWSASADVVRALPSGSLSSNQRGGKR